MKPIVYMAHPFRGDGEGNLISAKTWLKWLLGQFPDAIFIAPWIPDCEIHDDSDPIEREAGLVRDCAVVERCDAIILVGKKVSPGMLRESTYARLVFDCTNPNGIPPDAPSEVFGAFSVWVRQHAEARPDLQGELLRGYKLDKAHAALQATHKVIEDYFKAV